VNKESKIWPSETKNSLRFISPFSKENGCENIVKYLCQLWSSSTHTQTNIDFPVCTNCKTFTHTVGIHPLQLIPQRRWTWCSLLA